jgi:hypothetical protein
MPTTYLTVARLCSWYHLAYLLEEREQIKSEIDTINGLYKSLHCVNARKAGKRYQREVHHTLRIVDRKIRRELEELECFLLHGRLPAPPPKGVNVLGAMRLYMDQCVSTSVNP